MNESVEAQVSEPDQSYRKDLRISLVVGALGFLGAQWLLFIKGPGKGDTLVSGILLELLACAFLGFSLLMWTNRKRHAIGFDEDGLWLLHIGKQRGLVPWSRIAAIRESGLWCRMSLYGNGGEKLINVEYQRSHFQELRNLVMGRMSFRPPTLPIAFRLAIWTRVLLLGLAAVAGALVGFTYVAPKSESGPIISLWQYVLGPFFVLFSIFMLALVVIGRRSVVERDHLRIGRRTFPFSDIDSVSMSFRRYRDQMYPWVWITLKNGMREYAGPSNSDSLTFQRTLQWALDRWRDENAGTGAH
jgi:hypothetical protein